MYECEGAKRMTGSQRHDAVAHAALCAEEAEADAQGEGGPVAPEGQGGGGGSLSKFPASVSVRTPRWDSGETVEDMTRDGQPLGSQLGDARTEGKGEQDIGDPQCPVQAFLLTRDRSIAEGTRRLKLRAPVQVLGRYPVLTESLLKEREAKLTVLVGKGRGVARHDSYLHEFYLEALVPKYSVLSTQPLGYREEEGQREGKETVMLVHERQNGNYHRHPATPHTLSGFNVVRVWRRLSVAVVGTVAQGEKKPAP
ncbi:hypothetical protein C8R46DRAFT_1277394 [Mycena filopes]|nr:hypothetical protein C8R46DRAFT_1277394 [Mycena filopes]